MYTLFVIPISYITKLFITVALFRLNYVSKTSEKHSFEHEDVAYENKSNNKSVKKEKEPRDNARKNKLKKKISRKTSSRSETSIFITTLNENKKIDAT